MILRPIAVLALALLPCVQGSSVPGEQDFKKAKDKLLEDPQDPAANTTAGKYLAFVQGDFAAALPFLALSGDKTLKALAEHEQDPTYVDTPVKKVGMGDEWVAGAKKFPPLLRAFHDRAAYWYSQAWASLDNVWKDKTRTQLRKIYQNPTVGDPKGLAAPTGWKLSDQAQHGMQTTKAARSGRASFQVMVQKSKEVVPVVLQQEVFAVPGAAYEISGWFLPDGTDLGGDHIGYTIFAQGGKPITAQRLLVPPDEPWWHYVSMKFEAPKDALQIWVQIALNSKTGILYVDDVSLKTGGKEILKNGSFEDK